MASEAVQRRERAAKLGAAIEEYLNGIEHEAGMLGDWLLVGSVVRVDEEGDPDAQYFVALSGGSMLQHHALGLLTKAEDVLQGGEPDE